MAEPGIDPRYAAQFQRGYDPAVHPASPVASAASTREAPVRLPGGPPSSAPLVAGAPPRVPREPGTEGPPASAPIPNASIDHASSSHASSVEPPASALSTHDEEPSAPLSVRLEWALLAAGVALLLAAAWLFWQSAIDVRQYVGVTDPAEQSTILVRNSLPGPLLVAAVVAASSWIVLRATRGGTR